MNKISIIFIILSFLSHILFIGCSKGNSTTSNCQLNKTLACQFYSSKAITSFSLNGTDGKIIGSNISVVMPYGTDLTRLIASFTTNGKSVKIGIKNQSSGQTSNDFSRGIVTYTVFAADGSKQNYSVSVSEKARPLSSEKEITSFSINGRNGYIYTASATIIVIMPYHAILTGVVPHFTASPRAKVFVGRSEQTSGITRQDFSNGRVISYIVVAEDGSMQSYTVLCH